MAQAVLNAGVADANSRSAGAANAGVFDAGVFDADQNRLTGFYYKKIYFVMEKKFNIRVIHNKVASPVQAAFTNTCINLFS